MYIILAIIVFGVLIATHEFGHFAAAKLSGVKVNEFSVGMGPAIFKKQKGETLYSLRLLPLGGYCAMEGEDDDSESADPRAFQRVSPLRQLIILAAGAGMNFLTGLLLIALLYSQAVGFLVPAVSGFIDGYGLEDCGLQAGDVILKINGNGVYDYNDFITFLGRAGDTVDFVVERDGEKVNLNGVYMPLQEGVDEEGNTTWLRGFMIRQEPIYATFVTRVQYTFYTLYDYVRTVWMSLGDLVRGIYGIDDLSGPIGIVDTMSQIGSQAESTGDAVQDLIYLTSFLAVNLAVMNLLPLPALDGGRIIFLLLNLILPKKIPAKYEGYVHLAGMAALMVLMLVVTLNDVGKLFGV